MIQQIVLFDSENYFVVSYKLLQRRTTKNNQRILTERFLRRFNEK